MTLLDRTLTETGSPEDLTCPDPRGSGVADDRRFLSLFSGAGGLDAGLEMAGWRSLAALEMDHDAAETLRLNVARSGASTEIIESKIEDVAPGKLRRGLGLSPGELPLLAGGPPCQPFTTHGKRRSIFDDRAAEVWPTYLSYLDEFIPKALVIENVDGLLSAAIRHRPLAERKASPLSDDEKKGSFLKWFLRQLSLRGYTVSWGLVEAADYGVPQLRQRSVLIGVLGDDPCYLPPATHGGAGLEYRTLAHALERVKELGPIQPLSARKKAIYQQIPAGGNWRSLPEDLQKLSMGGAYLAEGGKSGWWRRLSMNSPTPTILGMPDHSSTALVHPTELRCLSVVECAAAQSFSPEHQFAGKARSQYQQIGNAVPPLLGRAIGEQISAFLEGDRGPTPEPPAWRRASGNRRIGTHGWVFASSAGRTGYRSLLRCAQITCGPL